MVKPDSDQDSTLTPRLNILTERESVNYTLSTWMKFFLTSTFVAPKICIVLSPRVLFVKGERDYLPRWYVMLTDIFFIMATEFSRKKPTSYNVYEYNNVWKERKYCLDTFWKFYRGIYQVNISVFWVIIMWNLEEVWRSVRIISLLSSGSKSKPRNKPAEPGRKLVKFTTSNISMNRKTRRGEYETALD